MKRLGSGVASDLLYAQPFIPILRNKLKTMIRQATTSKWQRLWDSHTGFRISRLFIPKIKEQKVPTNLGSKELQFLSQIITGHGLFRRHIGKWLDISDISCSLCGEADEDPWHLWEYCPSLSSERGSVLLQIKQGLPWYLGLMKFFRLKQIKEIYASNEALLVPD